MANDTPMLKFEKSTTYLKEQLEIQNNNKQLVLDIIANIGLISNKNDNNEKYIEILNAANNLLIKLSTNITNIEQSLVEISNISKDFSDVLKSHNSKSKEYYIAALSNVKATLYQYTENFQKLEKVLNENNAIFEEFINQGNFKYTFSKNENGDSEYKFESFSVNDTDSSNVTNTEEIENNNVQEQTNTEEIIDEKTRKINELTDEFRSIITDIYNGKADDNALEKISSYLTGIQPEITEESTKQEENIEETVEDLDLSDINLDDILNVEESDSNLAEEIKIDDLLAEENLDDLLDIFNDMDDTNNIVEENNNAEFSLDEITTELNESLTENLNNQNVESFDNIIQEVTPIENNEEVIEQNSIIEENVEEIPVVEETIEQAPITEEKIEEVPIVEETIEQAPITEENIEEIPVVEETIEQAPITEENVEEVPVVEETIEQAPITEENVKEIPVVEETIEQAPITEENVEEISVVENITEEPSLIEETINNDNSENYSSILSLINSTLDPYSNNNQEQLIEDEYKDELTTDNTVLDEDIIDSISIEDIDNIENDNNSLSIDDLFSNDDVKEEEIIEEVKPAIAIKKESHPYTREEQEKVIHDQYANFNTIDEKIKRIKEAKADNEVLIISEKTKTVYLPYKIEDLIGFYKAYPENYNNLQDVVDSEYTLPLDYFIKHPYKGRFSEAYNLYLNRSKDHSKIKALFYSIKLTWKSNLDPSIIAACHSPKELDTYLYCLNNNNLDTFKVFRIIRDIAPIKRSANHNHA